jgi:Tfp pilus assembly protein PilE
MKRSAGFTVIEIIVAVLFLASATVILFTQRANLVAIQRDATRKTAINAMYYSLEEVYYPAHNNSYPGKLDKTTLPSVDPALFTDPNGNTIGSGSSNYRYEGTNCSTDGVCKSYTLRALLEKEADYVKTSRHQ